MTQDLFYQVTVVAGPASYDLSHDLSSFTIEEENTKPDQLTLNISDRFKVFSHALQEGMEIVVDLGNVQDHSIVFRGQIYKTEADFSKQDVPTLKLVAYDRSMKMGLRKRNLLWTDISLEGIVNKIGGAYFYSEDLVVNLRGNPRFTGNGIRQQNETDLAFLRRLGQNYGCEMNVIADQVGEGLYFTSQYHIMKNEPVAVLYHGRSNVKHCLLSFHSTSDISQVELSRVFSGIEFKTGKAIALAPSSVLDVGSEKDVFADDNLAEWSKQEPVKAEKLKALLVSAGQLRKDLKSELGSVERLATPAFTTTEELEERAKNQFSINLKGMHANGTTVGNHRLHAQTTVSIADVGGRFSGTWYLSQVRHMLNGQGYQTEFQCQR